MVDVRRLVQMALDLWERSEPPAVEAKPPLVVCIEDGKPAVGIQRDLRPVRQVDIADFADVAIFSAWSPIRSRFVSMSR